MVVNCKRQGKDLRTGARICMWRGRCRYECYENECENYEADDKYCKRCKNYQGNGICSRPYDCKMDLKEVEE